MNNSEATTSYPIPPYQGTQIPNSSDNEKSNTHDGNSKISIIPDPVPPPGTPIPIPEVNLFRILVGVAVTGALIMAKGVYDFLVDDVDDDE